jgi:RNA polymerase sigma factor (sigma-70 family)
MTAGAEREERYRQLLPLVGRLARGLARVYPFCEYDDLFQDGCVGMLRAAATFDPSRGVPLEAYARPLVAGAIFNGIRTRDPLSENARKLLRSAERERTESRKRGDQEPTLRELATRISGLGAALLMAYRADTLSLSRPLPEGNALPIDWSDDPARLAEERDRTRRLHAALATLTERQRSVVAKVYFGHKSVTTIGEEMSISSQRVSQLHQSAIANMRKALAANA